MLWKRVLQTLFLMGAAGLGHSQVQFAEPVVNTCGNFDALSYEGLYTDKASYVVGDTVTILGNWPNKTVKYRIARIGPNGSDPYGSTYINWANDSNPISYDTAYKAPFGSYVSLPDIDLSTPVLGPAETDRNEFTIEGWVRPSYIWPAGTPTQEREKIGDVIVAGQVELDGSAFGGVGIGIRANGKPFAIASVTDTNPPHSTMPIVLEGNTELEVNKWYYLALTMRVVDPGGGDVSRIQLWVGEGNLIVAPVATSTLSSVYELSSSISSLEFRLGARNEAPGVNTGCLSGRLDRWGAWDNEGLTLNELKYRQHGGFDPPSGPHPFDQPDDVPIANILFEDPYGDVVANDGSGGNGVLVGHGTPGMSGRPSDTRGVRLNHDQLIEAKFDEAKGVEYLLTDSGTSGGAPLPSGLYSVQAVFKNGGRYDYDEDYPVNTEPNHFCCFVVRPDVDNEEARDRSSIAVLLPVNTWMAYNSWPGEYGQYEGGINRATASGLEVRPLAAESGTCYSQGNNSAYSTMGDGESPCHYMGWMRPNIASSPIHENSILFNYAHAANDANLIRWLHDPPVVLTGPLDYEVYSDWDLHSILEPHEMIDYDTQSQEYVGHRVLMLVGQHEYWSDTMLSRLHAYIDRGGSVISIGGNAIGYRSELKNTVDQSSNVTGVTGVLEVKKWPTGFQMLGDWDSYSLMADTGSPSAREKTGGWRFIEQIKTPPSSRDFVLGTLPDMHGFRGPDGRAEVDQYGLWEVQSGGAGHVWWPSAVVNTKVGSNTTGRVVGHEADRFVNNNNVPHDQYAPEFEYGVGIPASLPTVLAIGTELDPLADGDDLLNAPQIYRGADEWDFDETALNVLAKDDRSGPNPFAAVSVSRDVNAAPMPPYVTTYYPMGQIVAYQHKDGADSGYAGRGWVLSIAAIGAPYGLMDSDTDISELVARALVCMLTDGSCP